MKRPKSRFPKRDHVAIGEREYFETIPSDRLKVENYPRLVDLSFSQDAETNPYGYPDGYWVMGGSVQWPVYIKDEGLVGMSHSAGLHLETRRIYFFSERKFITLEMSPDYPLDAPRPLKTWLEACYELFHLTTYYYQDIQTTAEKFLSSSRKCFRTQPRPYFVSFPWINTPTALQTVHEYNSLGRLVIPEDMRLDKELMAYDADPEGEFPALFSATVLINALDKFVNSQYVIEKVIDNLRSI
jgi:hypothetical protein